MLSGENKLKDTEIAITKQGEEAEKSDLHEQKVSRGYLFKKGDDPKRNLAGRPKGAKGFATIFEKALKRIGTDDKINLKDPETQMVVRAVVEALKGNLGYFNSIMDRVHGKPKETIDVSSGSLPVILEISRGKDRDTETPP